MSQTPVSESQASVSEPTDNPYQADIESSLTRPSGAAIAFLSAIVGVCFLVLMIYCFVVARRGLGSDSIFFNLVELLPLALAVIVFWTSALLGLRKRHNR